jgi:hypothetical protein
MAIDKSGKWWKGQNADDLVEYVRLLTQQGYPATKFAIAKCACGTDRFRLYADQDEGCAKRQCTSCGKDAFICDSEDASEEASLKKDGVESWRRIIHPTGLPLAALRPLAPAREFKRYADRFV